jgi:hypothetical protein
MQQSPWTPGISILRVSKISTARKNMALCDIVDSGRVKGLDEEAFGCAEVTDDDE